MLNRRHFVFTTAAVAAAQSAPKRLAVLADSPRYSDRFRNGYPYAGAWHKPAWQIVDRFSAVTDADAVLIDGPDLPKVLEVFEHDGRAVPVFHPGPLADTFAKSTSIVEASRRLKFPLLAGSSLPFTWRLPAIDIPYGAELDSALAVCPNKSTLFDAVEALQCMVERRRGGETGVQSVESLDADSAFPKDLAAAALSRSDTPLGLTVTDGRTQDLLKSGLITTPPAYRIHYRDGLQATILLLDGVVQDFTFAARQNGSGQIWSTQFLRTPDPAATHAACLAHHAARMFETRTPPCPVERTQLAAGILEKASNLNVSYRAPRDSPFAQS